VLVRLLRQEAAVNGAGLERFWAAARASARADLATGERVLDAGTDHETGFAFLIREWPQNNAAEAPTRPLTVPKRPSPSRSRRSPTAFLAISAFVVLVGLGSMLLRPLVAGWLAWVNSPIGTAAQGFALPTVGPAPLQTSAQTAAAAQNTPAPAPTRAATAAPARAATPEAGVPRRVVNTDGRGVALRDAPGGNRLPGKGYDEGATVTAFESSGQWTRIKGSDGREGWVLSVTLAQ
jgi:hypothetical protein